MDLNKHIETSQQFAPTQQQSSMEQDNASKTAFALKMIERPSQAAAPAEPPKIPSLGAMAIPN